MSLERASSIQKVESNDSIVACQQDAEDFFDSIGHLRTLLPWASSASSSTSAFDSIKSEASAVAAALSSPTPCLAMHSLQSFRPASLQQIAGLWVPMSQDQRGPGRGRCLQDPTLRQTARRPRRAAGQSSADVAG